MIWMMVKLRRYMLKNGWRQGMLLCSDCQTKLFKYTLQLIIDKVNFTDKTEIILSSEHKMVTYVNKKAERSHYPLATALDS